jgi:hypothetical protein
VRTTRQDAQIEKIGRCIRLAADRMQVDIVDYLISHCGAYPAINMINMSLSNGQDISAQDCIIKALEQRQWREEVTCETLPSPPSVFPSLANKNGLFCCNCVVVIVG